MFQMAFLCGLVGVDFTVLAASLCAKVWLELADDYEAGVAFRL